MPLPVHHSALCEQYFYSMEGQFINIGQMMQHMNNGLPFSIVYVTYDKATGKGGAVKRIEMATKCWPKVTDSNPATETASGAKTSPLGAGGGSWSPKNPNHFSNSTVNIRVSAAGQADIRKVHVQLIRQFNGLIVK